MTFPWELIFIGDVTPVSPHGIKTNNICLSHAGKIIGKKGKNIQEILDLAGTFRVQINDDNKKSPQEEVSSEGTAGDDDSRQEQLFGSSKAHLCKKQSYSVMS